MQQLFSRTERATHCTVRIALNELLKIVKDGCEVEA